MEAWLVEVVNQYNFYGAVAVLVAMVLVTKVGKFLIFKVPALAEMKKINEKADAEKLSLDKYKPIVKKNDVVGFFCNLVFFLLVLPFAIGSESVSILMIVLDAFLILIFYDFFYYLVHRFWFHGSGPMRKIHALHHQARKPTFIDAYYVHPMETLVGLVLLMLSVSALAFFFGQFHVATIVIMYVLYVQLNTINHTFIDLPYFPFKTLNWIAKKHHVHHENMQMGNYASMVMLYDKIFGTLD